MPTKLHHHLQAWSHSTPVTSGFQPLHFALEVLHVMGSTHNSPQVSSRSPLDDSPPSSAPTASPSHDETEAWDPS